jgi:Undecaprenyl-phosphate galactose phosphotransferase WbaP
MGTLVETCRELARTRIRTASPAANPAVTGLVLVLTDAAALLTAGWLGLRLWSLVNSHVGLDFYPNLWPVLGLFLLVYAWLGLYPGAGLNPVEELRSTALGTTTGYLISAASIFFSKEVGAHSRGVFLAAWFCSIVSVPLGRALVRNLLADRPWWGVPVLVLGAGRSARLVVSRLKAQPAIGLKPVVCFDDGGSKKSECAGIPVAGPLSMAPQFARTMRIKHALVAMPGLKRQQLIGLLERMGAVFAHLIVIPDLFGMASLWVSPRDLSGVLGLEVRQNLLVPVNRWLKRGLDLAAGTALGILALPVVAAAVLWVKRVSPGSAFYVQDREGEAGRTIRVRKLRTMHLNADRLLEQHLVLNPEAQQEWRRYFKLRKDPRILPGIGHLLRRTSLDELPQLWNVIKGEMSLVGPRPFPYYHLEQFDRRFRSLRSRVSPGLTGLWQVSTRSDGDLRIQETLDTYYIRNWSLWLDLHILARTVRAVLFRQGAY